MCHVLIIEDEPSIALLIEMVLEEAGATSCDVAVTQDDAIAAARAHPPHVITSDVRLIEGTGPLAVAAICSELGQLPVIYITANPDACEPRAEASAIIAKPIPITTLIRTFSNLCN
ncbi:response regulator [Sphingomonas sp. Tas61C01]|uniref:response regulator n=1 Tax=Sphingomonas sp. Tas61C01 TaxID=3458297 RepID=UPI00403EDA63